MSKFKKGDKVLLYPDHEYSFQNKEDGVAHVGVITQVYADTHYMQFDYEVEWPHTTMRLCYNHHHLYLAVTPSSNSAAVYLLAEENAL